MLSSGLVGDRPADAGDDGRQVGLPARASHLDRHEAGSGRLSGVCTVRRSPVPGDETSDERAMAVTVLPRVPLAGQVDAIDHAAGEIGQRGDAGVEHGDVDAGTGVALGPQLGGAALLREDRGRILAGRPDGALHVHGEVGRDHDPRDGLEHRDFQRIELRGHAVHDREGGPDGGADSVHGADDATESARRGRDDVFGRSTAEQPGLGRRRQRHDRSAQCGSTGEQETPEPDTTTTHRATGTTPPDPHVSPSPECLRVGR